MEAAGENEMLEKKENILVSACLLGINCRYTGTGTLLEEFVSLKENYNLIPVCPEIYGGLATPRDSAEQIENKVVTVNGEDVTEAYQRGAEEILQLAKFYGCKTAILKERSPSCGFGKIYDGTFTHTIIDGNGITAELLAQNGIQILGETQIDCMRPKVADGDKNDGKTTGSTIK